MTALPIKFYGDPSNCVDELRRLNKQAKRKDERARINKGLRIRALVKQAKRGGSR